MSKIKEAGQTVLKFGAGAAGLTVAAFGLKKTNELLPASTPDIAKKVVPGLVSMLIAWGFSAKVANEKAKSLAFGIGLAGFADLLLKTLGPKVGFIQANVPALSGLGVLPGYVANNAGGTGWNYYRDNALQGLGNAYALNGDSIAMQGTSMQGTSMQGLGKGGGAMSAANGYALSGTAYALS